MCLTDLSACIQAVGRRVRSSPALHPSPPSPALPPPSAPVRPSPPCSLAPLQDEFSFYLEDTACKLLLLPSEGNPAAEQAAAKHRVPVAKLAVAIGQGKRGVVGGRVRRGQGDGRGQGEMGVQRAVWAGR